MDATRTTPEDQGEVCADSPAPSFAALPPDLLRSIFCLVFSPAADSSSPAADSSGRPAAPAAGSSPVASAAEAAALAGLPLRQAVRQWFALRLTCRPWAAALQGLALPPLEVWAACPACLAWLGRPKVGVQALRFIRRAPRRMQEPVGHCGDFEGGEAAPLQPPDRRREWRQQRSVGVDLSDSRRTLADEMLHCLKNIGVYRRGTVKVGRTWSFEGWRHLQSLSLQGPSAAGNEPTWFDASPTLSHLPKLHTLDLRGFTEYQLEGAPTTLRVLRFVQRQAGVHPGTPGRVQLWAALSSSMRLDSCFFELLPAHGQQLARQDGQQAPVDVDLAWLRSRCRRLDVVGPVVAVDCACPRCEAAARADSGSDCEGGWGDWGGSSGGSSGLGSVQSMTEEELQQAIRDGEDYARLHPEEEEEEDEDSSAAFTAGQLERAAAQLAAPGSLLERVTLRSSAPFHVLLNSPGLMLAFCIRRQYVSLYNRLTRSSKLGAAVARANKTLGDNAGAAVAVSFESLGGVPAVLTLRPR